MLFDVAYIVSDVKAMLSVPPLTELKTLGGFFWRRLEIVMSEPPVIWKMVEVSIGGVGSRVVELV